MSNPSYFEKTKAAAELQAAQESGAPAPASAPPPKSAHQRLRELKASGADPYAVAAFVQANHYALAQPEHPETPAPSPATPKPPTNLSANPLVRALQILETYAPQVAHEIEAVNTSSANHAERVAKSG